jgi:integrase
MDRSFIPSKEQYKETIKRLIDNNQIKTLIATRMGCEMGLSRLEIANSRISDLDRIHPRGLWIEIAKRVRRGSKRTADGKKKPVFEARSREIPVNSSLYALIKSFLREGQIYILYREKGDVNKPFVPRYINTLYEENNVPWSTHMSRHFFKNMVMDWMRTARQVDEGLLSELLGHKKSQTQDYGSLSWDYKRDVVDKVFEG